MTMTYFSKQICEELDGACEYIKLAIANKLVYPSWSKQFVEMSTAELAHATMLFKMFDEFYTNLVKDISEQDRAAMPWLEEAKSEIVENYTNKYTKVKIMHDLYNK